MILEQATPEGDIRGAAACAGLAGAGAEGTRAPVATLRCYERAHELEFEDPYRVTVVFSVAGDASWARFSAGEGQVPAGPGCVGVLPPGTCGVWRAVGWMEYVNVRFPILFSSGRVPPEPFCRSDDGSLARIGQLLAAALHTSDELEPWDLSAWSTLIGSHLARRYAVPRGAVPAGDDAPSGISQAIAYIDSNLQDALKVADLAAWAGMPRSTFAAAFKRQTGVSPHRFIVSRRIEKAREMMASGSQSLAEIAQATGFCSQSHMTRAFRDRLGVTPKDHRDRLRKSGQLSRAVPSEGTVRPGQ